MQPKKAKMKFKTALLWGTFMISLPTFSKSMVDLWLSMPIKMIPYIGHDSRLEMTKYVSTGTKKEVKHSLEGTSKIDTITADYLHITLNSAVELDIKRLPYQSDDSIICVVQTWSAPQKESKVCFYNQEWHPIHLTNPLSDKAKFCQLVKPDTMTQEDFTNISQKLNVILVSASLSISNQTMVVHRSVPIFSSEENDKIKNMLPTITMKWNGLKFE